MDLRGKVAVVTGASAGIGKQIALDLAAAGAAVGLIARRQERIDELRDAIRQRGGTSESYAADVSDLSAMQGAATFLEESLGPVDILINNAGFGKRLTFEETPIDEFEKVMAVNYLGTVYGMKIFGESMRRRRTGHIINIASVAGEVPSPTFGAYNATKFAVVALSTSVASELAADGIKLSLVNPGPVDTEFFDDPTWEGRKPHGGPLPMATSGDCSAAVFEVLRTGKFKVRVPKYLGGLSWLYRVSGPLGRFVLAQARW